MNDLGAQAGCSGADDGLLLPHGLSRGEPEAFMGGTLQNDIGIALQGIHFLVLNDLRIVEQMDILISLAVPLNIMQYRPGVDIVAGLHCPNERELHRGDALLDLAIDVYSLPGILPAIKACHLGNQRTLSVKAAANQSSHPLLFGQGAIFGVEGINPQSDDLRLFCWNIVKDGEASIEEAELVCIKKLAKVVLGIRIGISRVDVAEPERRAHPGIELG